MNFEPQPTETISLDLTNGHIVQVEITDTGRRDVSFDRKAFKDVTDALAGIVDEIAGVIHKTLPTKATVKFGVDVGIESGQLTAMIVKGSSKANLEITLEWDRSSSIKINP
jgi:hypothetical protein